MKFRPKYDSAERLAELKLRIIRQQELAADFCRGGELQDARVVRARILALTNQLEIVEMLSE